MVGDGQRGAAVGGGREANERLVRPRKEAESVALGMHVRSLGRRSLGCNL